MTEIRDGWKGSISLEYRYTAGVAGQKYLDGLKKGRILATRCASCGVTYLPPRIYCERCLSRLDDWVEVKPEGELYSYTVTRTKDGPRVIGLARFDGVEGGVLAPIRETRKKLELGARARISLADGRAEIVL